MYYVDLVYPNGLRKNKVTCKTESLATAVLAHYEHFFSLDGYTRDPEGTMIDNHKVQVELYEADNQKPSLTV